jgi:hypothetical protein
MERKQSTISTPDYRRLRQPVHRPNIGRDSVHLLFTVDVIFDSISIISYSPINNIQIFKFIALNFVSNLLLLKCGFQEKKSWLIAEENINIKSIKVNYEWIILRIIQRLPVRLRANRLANSEN